MSRTRFSLSLVMLISLGCSSIIPQPPIQVTLPPYTNYEGVMAMEIAYTCPSTSDTVPDNTPKPSTLKEGDKCPHCVNGKLTKDGVPTDDCWHCLGDGICNKNDPILANPGELVITIFGEMVEGINEQLKQIPGKKCTCVDCKCVDCDQDNCTCKECPKACLPIPQSKEVVIDASPKDLLPRKQFKEVVHYYIYKDKDYYFWNDSISAFVSKSGSKIYNQTISDISTTPSVTICYGSHCLKHSVYKLVQNVEVTDDQPRATQRPANGEGK